jgi:hypothetical protein
MGGLLSTSENPEGLWLVRLMSRSGVSNQDLHQALVATGWSGAPNNLSNWRNGQTRIPLELLPAVVRGCGLDPGRPEGISEIVRFLRLRHPELSDFIVPDPLPPEVHTAGIGERPVYWCRRGVHQGKRFVPYQDAAGNFVLGMSRFEEDKQLFRDLRSAVAALRANPKLCIRMALEDSPRSAPSLIRQESLTWEN